MKINDMLLIFGFCMAITLLIIVTFFGYPLNYDINSSLFGVIGGIGAGFALSYLFLIIQDIRRK